MKKISGIMTILLLFLITLMFSSCSEDDILKDVTEYQLIDGEFKILTLADLHFKNDGSAEDSEMFNRMDALVESADSDLLILLGDVVYPYDIWKIPENMEIVRDHMDTYKIPWAFVMGNHDSTGVASMVLTREMSVNNKKLINTILIESEYCIYKKGPDDIDGYGNYFVNIKDGEKIIETLFFFDSGDYIKEEDLTYDFVDESNLNKTGFIYLSQISWYEKSVNDIKEYNGGTVVPSMAFFHIPLPEYRTAMDLYNQNSTEATLIDGRMEDGIGKSPVNTGLFDKMVELKSTKAIFTGHDHGNNFNVKYKGINLCYNGALRLIPYGLSDEIIRSMFGGRVVTIKSDGTFTNEILLYDDVK